jgi:hypothetical protein
MSEPTQRTVGHEPSLQTVEMLCDRLAEMGLAVGPDTARTLLREIFDAEAPRMDARLRDALDTSLQTIRIAAQSAMGLLATTGSEAARKREPARPEQLHVSRHAPPRKPPPPPPEPKHVEPRPSGPRRPRVELDDDERRPVFRRPGRR